MLRSVNLFPLKLANNSPFKGLFWKMLCNVTPDTSGLIRFKKKKYFNHLLLLHLHHPGIILADSQLSLCVLLLVKPTNRDRLRQRWPEKSYLPQQITGCANCPGLLVLDWIFIKLRYVVLKHDRLWSLRGHLPMLSFPVLIRQCCLIFKLVKTNCCLDFYKRWCRASWCDGDGRLWSELWWSSPEKATKKLYHIKHGLWDKMFL